MDDFWDLKGTDQCFRPPALFKRAQKFIGKHLEGYSVVLNRRDVGINETMDKFAWIANRNDGNKRDDGIFGNYQ